jgi:hypothetical protein
MAYDSPKAAHFTALDNGVLLPRLHLRGLDARWYAAGLCENHGIRDMMRLTEANKIALLSVCQIASSQFGLQIVCNSLT